MPGPRINPVRTALQTLQDASRSRALIGIFDIIGTTASGWLTDRYDPRKLLFAYYDCAECRS